MISVKTTILFIATHRDFAITRPLFVVTNFFSFANLRKLVIVSNKLYKMYMY